MRHERAHRRTRRVRRARRGARGEGHHVPERRAGARLTEALPPAVDETLRRFVAAELTTVDRRGRPVTWPVTPFRDPGGPGVRVTTALGYPKKALDAQRNPRVALLFSDAVGSGIEDPSMVLLQGIATVDDEDLDANRMRYEHDSAAKPTGPDITPSGGRRFDWYFTRIYIEIEIRRVLVWPRGDCRAMPDTYGQLEHEPPPALPAAASYGPDRVADRRIAEIGTRYETAVLSVIRADGFPESIRLPMTSDRRGRTIDVELEPAGITLQPGPACVTAHDHDPELRWMRNFQVRGDLARDANGWYVIPKRVVHGFELPPTGALARAVLNVPKIRRFRKTARRQRARRRAP